MRHSPRARRTPSKLSESIHHQLSMYALAATSAGVGVLALSSSAEAKIVYTPVNVVVHFHNLDLNHDGITDFTFGFQTNQWGRTSSTFRSQSLYFYGADSNVVAGGGGSAAALWPGAEIGPKRRLWGRGEIERIKITHRCATCTGTHTHTTFFGQWANGGKGFKGHYLGLKFLINGKVHYGWARLNTTGGPADTVLTGYAYETIPGKSIIAGQTKGAADEPGREDFGSGAFLTNPIPATPQPASLGVLALGAQGIPLRRKGSTLEGN